MPNLLRTSAWLGAVCILGHQGLSMGAAVVDIPGLDSITFWERTGGAAPTAFTFDVNSTELTTRLSDPLGVGNADISGALTEFYDVFYSDSDGTFNAAGEFVTIEGVFQQALPNGGGLNLAEMELNFSSDPGEFGNVVASFVTNGDNAEPTSPPLAIDGDLQTHTTMGNTIDFTGRLRLTLGFESSSGPIDPGPEPNPIPLPAAAWTGLATIAGSALFGKSRRPR